MKGGERMEGTKKTTTIINIADDIQNILAKYHITIDEMNKVLADCSEIIGARTIIKSLNE